MEHLDLIIDHLNHNAVGFDNNYIQALTLHHLKGELEVSPTCWYCFNRCHNEVHLILSQKIEKYRQELLAFNFAISLNDYILSLVLLEKLKEHHHLKRHLYTKYLFIVLGLLSTIVSGLIIYYLTVYLTPNHSC